MNAFFDELRNETSAVRKFKAVNTKCMLDDFLRKAMLSYLNHHIDEAGYFKPIFFNATVSKESDFKMYKFTQKQFAQWIRCAIEHDDCSGISEIMYSEENEIFIVDVLSTKTFNARGSDVKVCDADTYLQIIRWIRESVMDEDFELDFDNSDPLWCYLDTHFNNEDEDDEDDVEFKNDTCPICLEESECIVCPNNHASGCSSCCSKIEKCPMCRLDFPSRTMKYLIENC